MKKTLIGLGLTLMFSPFPAGAAYTSLSYVQDGLVAQWDGIENAGRGVHDPNAAHPVELVTNLTQTLTGTMPAHEAWFELGSGDLGFLLPTNICTAINAGRVTVEIVLARNGSNVNNGGFLALGTATRGFWTWQSTAALVGGCSYHANNEYTTMNHNADGTNTVYFLLGSNSNKSSWGVNAVKTAGVTRNSTNVTADDPCTLGALPGYSRPNAQVFSIRVYDRVLTSAELESNREIDVQRFIRGLRNGKDVHVSPTGNDTTGDGSKGNPFASLEKGVESCADGDTLVLLKGRHDRLSSAAAITVTKDITIRGETDDPWETVVNINRGNGPVFTLNNRYAVLKSLAMTNAVGSAACGSALKVTAGCVTNCVFWKCDSTGNKGGAAIYANGSKATVVDCVVSNCSFFSNNKGVGGVYLNDAGARLEHCLVAFCTAEETTAGVGGVRVANGILEDCTIVGCSSRDVGGLVLAAGSAERCIVAGNISRSSGSAHADICPSDVSRVKNSASTKATALDGTCVTDEAVNFFRSLETGDIRPAANPPVTYGYFPVDPTEPLVTLKIDKVSGQSPLTVGFTADTQGFAPGDDVVYTWNFGGGQPADPAAKSTSATFAAGIYTVSLTVENRTTGKTYSSVRSDVLTVSPSDVYVQPGGATGFTPTPPYTSWATAAASLHDVEAFFADGVVVHLKEGLYGTTNEIRIQSAVTVCGTGMDKTTIRRVSSYDHGIFEMNDPNAVLRDLCITGGKADYANNSGGGVRILSRGGIVEDCLITNNVSNARVWASGGGVRMASSSAVLRRCRILANSAGTGSGTGGGVYASDGVIEDCLVSGNSAPYCGGIVVSGAARVRNCTIAGNSCTQTDTGAGLRVDSGYEFEIRNCLVAQNVNNSYRSGRGPDWSITGSGSAEATNRFYTCAFGIPETNPGVEVPNETCIRFACVFSDTDCHCSASQLVDAGSSYEGVSDLDLDGNPRIVGAAVDIGCYENQNTALAVQAEITPSSAMVGSDFVFKALVQNEKPGASVDFTWTLTGGEITTPVVFHGREVTNALSFAGLINVRLEAVDTVHSETAEPFVKPAAFNVGAKTNYLAAVGTAGVTPTPPYSSWQTAATNIHDVMAVSADGSTLLIGPGIHPTTNLIALSTPRTVIGVDGADATTVRRVSTVAHTIFELNDPNVLLHGLRIENGSADDSNNSGGGVRIISRGGTVEDCILANNNSSAKTWASGGGISMQSASAVLRRCRLFGNTAQGNSGNGAAILMTAGLVENCLVSNNTSRVDGAVYVSGGIVRNCTIVRNHSVGTGYTAHKFVGGLRATDSGRIVNVLCVSNTQEEAVTEQSQPELVYEKADNVVNCGVVASTNAPNATCVCASGDALGFADITNGNYRLTRRSAFYKKGHYEPWMATAVDLDGLPRSQNPMARHPLVDIGCYESKLMPKGLSVLIR